MKRLLIFVAFGLLTLLVFYGLYRSGLLRFNYPNSTRFPVRGIDVSHHQGDIDWHIVKAAGVDFAFIKASEGGDYRDREFARNWEEAGRAGIARGAYHFFTFCTAGLDQAHNFSATTGRQEWHHAAVVSCRFLCLE